MNWKVLVLLAMGSMIGASNPEAAEYPSRPITILVGFAPGGIHEIVSRIVAEGLRARLGQPVIVELKPSASGILALNDTMRAEPDGYVLTATTSALAALPFISTSYKGDVVSGFSHLGILAQTPFLLATNADMPFSDVKGLVAYARANPGKLNFGAPTESVNLDFALFWQRTGIAVTSVPYRGTAPATLALIGNEVQLSAVSHRAISPYLQSGKLKPIGFASDRRFSLVPDIPTLVESIPGYSATTIWIGFSGPPGMSREVVTRLNSEMIAIVRESKVRATIVDKFAYEIVGGSPENMTAEMRAAVQRYAEAARLTGFKPLQ